MFPFRAKPCHTKNQLTCFTPVALNPVKTLAYFATNTSSSVHTWLAAVAIYNCKETQDRLYIVTQFLLKICQVVQSLKYVNPRNRAVPCISPPRRPQSRPLPLHKYHSNTTEWHQGGLWPRAIAETNYLLLNGPMLPNGINWYPVFLMVYH